MAKATVGVPAGDLVRELRTVYNISRPQLARAAGVTVAQLRAMELKHKKGLPTPEQARQCLESIREIVGERAASAAATRKDGTR